MALIGNLNNSKEGKALERKSFIFVTIILSFILELILTNFLDYIYVVRFNGINLAKILSYFPVALVLFVFGPRIFNLIILIAFISKKRIGWILMVFVSVLHLFNIINLTQFLINPNLFSHRFRIVLLSRAVSLFFSIPILILISIRSITSMYQVNQKLKFTVITFSIIISDFVFAYSDKAMEFVSHFNRHYK